jgi:putative oxidoreductase
MSISQHSDDRTRAPAILAALFSSPAVDHVLAPYGIFLLRVAIGVDWIVHAFLKTYRGMYTHEALLAKNGITPLLAWPTFSLEVIGGVAILLGWYTRQWAAFLLIFLSVVIWIKWPVGWLYSNTGGGWEYPLLWLLAQAALMLAGSGAFGCRPFQDSNQRWTNQRGCYEANPGELLPNAAAARLSCRMASIDHLPEPRSISTNIPPAMARSFSKCNNSLRLAKLV